jgi:hypothetical protein
MRTLAIIALSAMGCAGKLEPDSSTCPPDCPPTWAATTTGTGSTTTGGGGGPGTVDMCVVNTTALRACQATGCHTGDPSHPGDPNFLSAGLDLSATSVTTNAKLFLDKPNVGTPGVTMLGDPTGCPPGAFKLIDSANPSNSLLFLKPTAPGQMPTAPCGGKMPVIGTFTSAYKDCLTSWISSVIALK